MQPIIAPLSTFNFSNSQRLSVIETVCNLERIEYGDGKHRMPDVFSALIEKNDTGLICAMEGDKLLGYADSWQLQSRFYNELVYGIRAEEEICSEYILTPNDLGTGYWYVGSVITDPFLRSSSTYKAAQVFSEILRQTYLYFEDIKLPAKVMGVGSTEFGKNLLVHHGFKPVLASSQAIDLRPRFEKTLVELQLA
jgi:hypothetical protein